MIREVPVILYCWLWGHDEEAPFVLSNVLLSTLNHLEILVGVNHGHNKW